MNEALYNGAQSLHYMEWARLRLSSWLQLREVTVSPDIRVRRAKLSDAAAIADFVNGAHSGAPSAGNRQVAAADVAERFGQVGFMLAQMDGQPVGLLGWQVENLVVRVTDFLVSFPADPALVGQALIETMESEAKALVAEAVLLFLPPSPSARLRAFWEGFGYEFQNLPELHRAWREAVIERGLETPGVMVKRLREDAVTRPV